jgi:hypothetical protein
MEGRTAKTKIKITNNKPPHYLLWPVTAAPFNSILHQTENKNRMIFKGNV